MSIGIAKTQITSSQPGGGSGSSSGGVASNFSFGNSFWGWNIIGSSSSASIVSSFGMGGAIVEQTNPTQGFSDTPPEAILRIWNAPNGGTASFFGIWDFSTSTSATYYGVSITFFRNWVARVKVFSVGTGGGIFLGLIKNATGATASSTATIPPNFPFVGFYLQGGVWIAAVGTGNPGFSFQGTGVLIDFTKSHVFRISFDGQVTFNFYIDGVNVATIKNSPNQPSNVYIYGAMMASSFTNPAGAVQFGAAYAFTYFA